jgi:glucose-6-phosphate dehydrogenase assembly protein OpcA
VATAVLVDSRDAAGSGRLRALLELARRRTVVDLSWIRLQPWRELLASLFDPPERRLWLEGVQSVQVTGKIGPRQLLGGWLVTQLRLTPDQVHLTDAQHVEIRVECRHGSDTATFEVGRGSLQRTVSARSLISTGSGPASGPGSKSGSASGSGGPVAQPGASIPLAGDPLATSLSEALTHLQPDPVWERALSAASSFAR